MFSNKWMVPLRLLSRINLGFLPKKFFLSWNFAQIFLHADLKSYVLSSLLYCLVHQECHDPFKLVTASSYTMGEVSEKSNPAHLQNK